jgi:hypothetical protein
LTFAVKLDGAAVTPGSAEVSRSDSEKSENTTIGITDTGELTLTVADDEPVGYKVLAVTAGYDGITATASVTVHAPTGDFITKTLDGIFTVTGYTGSAEDIVIPDTIEGKTVIAIGVNAFKEKGLTSATIPDSVTAIGSNAFNLNQSLTSVTIGRDVYIEDMYSFYFGNFMDDYNTGDKLAGTYILFNHESWIKQNE